MSPIDYLPEGKMKEDLLATEDPKFMNEMAEMWLAASEEDREEMENFHNYNTLKMIAAARELYTGEIPTTKDLTDWLSL